MKNSKGFGAVEALLIVIIVGLIGFVGWYVWNSKQESDKSLNNAASANQANTVTAAKVFKYSDVTIPKDWKTYTNSQYGISFKYPKDWSLEAGNLNEKSVQKTEYFITAQESQANGVQINVNNMSLSEAQKMYNQDFLKDGEQKILSKSDILKNSFTGVKFVWGWPKMNKDTNTDILIAANNKVFEINGITETNTSNPTYAKDSEAWYNSLTFKKVN